jgi:membrane-bound inhibitor of C-type lysozyme
MEHKMKRRLTGIAAAALLLSACGDMNLRKYNPFGGDPVQERSRTPANATEYQCAGGKRLYVRTLEGGQAVWLILQERELRLERIGTSQRYSAGNTVLTLSGNEATVADGGPATYANCKTGGPEPAAAGK